MCLRHGDRGGSQIGGPFTPPVGDAALKDFARAAPVSRTACARPTSLPSVLSSSFPLPPSPPNHVDPRQRKLQDGRRGGPRPAPRRRRPARAGAGRARAEPWCVLSPWPPPARAAFSPSSLSAPPASSLPRLCACDGCSWEAVEMLLPRVAAGRELQCHSTASRGELGQDSISPAGPHASPSSRAAGCSPAVQPLFRLPRPARAQAGTPAMSSLADPTRPPWSRVAYPILAYCGASISQSACSRAPASPCVAAPVLTICRALRIAASLPAPSSFSCLLQR